LRDFRAQLRLVVILSLVGPRKISRSAYRRNERNYNASNDQGIFPKREGGELRARGRDFFNLRLKDICGVDQWRMLRRG